MNSTTSDNNLQAIDQLKESLLTMDRIGSERRVREALMEAKPLTVVEELIAPALEAIGEGWEQGGLALSQVYMSSRIAEDLVANVLHPDGRLRTPQPTMGIVVLEDYHMLGKRIIHSVLRAAGYEVEDLGQMNLASLVERLQQQPIQLLFVSTLMLRSALRVKELRDKLDELGLDTRLVVGGAPFRLDPLLAVEVNADATAGNAAELIPLVTRMVGEMI